MDPAGPERESVNELTKLLAIILEMLGRKRK